MPRKPFIIYFIIFIYLSIYPSIYLLFHPSIYAGVEGAGQPARLHQDPADSPQPCQQAGGGGGDPTFKSANKKNLLMIKLKAASKDSLVHPGGHYTNVKKVSK